MFLTLIDGTTEREVARASLSHTAHDIDDDKKMAALGRKLVAWVEEAQDDHEKAKAAMALLCDCSDQRRPADSAAKGLHSSECRVMFDSDKAQKEFIGGD